MFEDVPHFSSAKNPPRNPMAIYMQKHIYIYIDLVEVGDNQIVRSPRTPQTRSFPQDTPEVAVGLKLVSPRCESGKSACSLAVARRAPYEPRQQVKGHEKEVHHAVTCATLCMS